MADQKILTQEDREKAFKEAMQAQNESVSEQTICLNEIAMGFAKPVIVEK